MKWAQINRGFTIVELLIVVVVVAILATVTVVGYTGIQQRAQNSAIMGTAKQAVTAVQSYIAAEGAYPSTQNGVYICITTVSGCHTDNNVVTENASFEAEMKKIGALPRTTAGGGADRYGVFYHYHSSRVVNGVSQPALIIYYLQGLNQQCGVSGVVRPDPVGDTTSTTLASSTNGYSIGSAGGKTVCFISLPKP